MFRSSDSLILVVLLASTHLLAASLFRPVTTYPSGGAVSAIVTVADLNGDGKPDLILSNDSACIGCLYGSVGVLLGNGNGTFQAARTFDSGGNEPGSIAVADVNGDGKADVIVSNGCAIGTYCNGGSDTGSVAVLLGNGDGTLQTAQLFSSGDHVAASLALGDFNGDSKVDVAVLNLCGDPCNYPELAILLGNGDGTFQAPQIVMVGQEPLGIAVGDINHDGKLDVVVGADQSGSITILLGNGNGTFQLRQLLPYGISPELTDTNGDGNLDLVVAQPCGDARCSRGLVVVYPGNGDGTFQPGRSYSSGHGIADSIATSDINRDGNADVLVANYVGDPGKVGVLLGIGDGTFSPVQLSSAGVGSPESLAVADLNGDGKPDLIVGLYAFNHDLDSGGVGILLNNTFWKTTTGLSSNPNPSIQGQSVVFTATVNTGRGIEPTGKVTFTSGGKMIGSATLAGGVATLAKKNLPVGSLSISATYHGDTQYSKSTSSVLVQVVNPASLRQAP